MRFPQTAALVKSARLRQGISQEEGARRVGCTRLQWIHWEKGRHRPERYATALVSVLGVDEEALREADAETDSEAALFSAAGVSRDDYALFGALAARIISASALSGARA